MISSINPYQTPKNNTILPSEEDSVVLLVSKLMLALLIGSLLGAVCYVVAAYFAQINVTSIYEFRNRTGTYLAIGFCLSVAIWVSFWQKRFRPFYSGLAIAISVSGLFLLLGGRSFFIDFVIFPAIGSGLIFGYWGTDNNKKSAVFYVTLGAISGVVFCLCFIVLGKWIELYWFGMAFKIPFTERIWRESCSRTVSFSIASGLYLMAITYFLCYQKGPSSVKINE